MKLSSTLTASWIWHRQASPGGAAFTISPWIGSLTWAHGSVCTARGLLEVSWRRTQQRLEINVRAPQGTAVRFEPNPSLSGLDIHTELSQAGK